MAATMIVFLVTTLLCSAYVSCSEQCDECGNIAASHRIACGDDSMTRRGCSLRGCCWSSDGGPSCYMANIAAVKAIGYRRNDYFGELYPMSNALDGFDPTGLDPSNCALIDNTNHQYAEFTITFDTFHVISGVNLYGADGTLNDLAITVDYDLVGTNNGISCGIISADEESDEVHAKCSSPIIGQRIRIKSRSKTGPLRVCHVYVSGVKYQPQCALIDEKYKMQCLDSSASYEQCAAAGCCYDEAESPSCYLANVAYGKHVTKTPADKKIAKFTDGHIHDREEFYYSQSISIDLKRTYSIKKVIFHTYNSAHPATLELYVTKDGVYSESAVCKTTTLGNSVDTFPMQCDSPKNGKFIGFKNIGHWDCLLYEIIVLGQTVESSEFGPSSLQNWGKVDNNNKAIVIPDQSAGWTSAVGTVTGWKVSVGSTKAVHLSFWRPAEHGHFTYVGGTDFTPPSRGIHEIKLQEHQTFEIREGDVIGLQWNNGAVVRYKNNEDCGSDGVKHLIHVNPSPVHSKEQPVYFSEKNKCGSYQVVALVDP